jgi:hypothetical protein
MSSDRSPFLRGALAWLTGDGTVGRCEACGFDWSLGPDAALALIADAPAAYARLLEGRDGMAPAADGGWNATGYLWHLTDLARSWSERWAQLAALPGSMLVGWDPDVLADARAYRALPTAAARWALPGAVEAFLELSSALPASTPLVHGDWGEGTAGDAARWLAHEFHHHQLDVAERALPPG